MIIVKILFLFMAIVSADLAIVLSNKTNIYDCVIKNSKYNQNLYVSNDKHNFINTKLSRDHLLDSLSANRKVFTWSYISKDSMENMHWSLIEIDSNLNNKTSSFLIKNVHFNEYLCSSSFFVSDIFRKRRYVFTKSFDSIQNMNQCTWGIEKISIISKPTRMVVGNDDLNDEKNFKLPIKNRFLIWNLYYAEPMFAASSFFNMIQSGRSVYTWRNKQPDSDQFFWNIYCI